MNSTSRWHDIHGIPARWLNQKAVYLNPLYDHMVKAPIFSFLAPEVSPPDTLIYGWAFAQRQGLIGGLDSEYIFVGSDKRRAHHSGDLGNMQNRYRNPFSERGRWTIDKYIYSIILYDMYLKMKWKDHRRLIIAAARKQYVPHATYRGLLEGVIYPDKTNSWRKEHGRSMESHHNLNIGKIIDLIRQARRFWISGKENDAGFQLGQALHYIHDGLVSKGFTGLSHDSNESKIQTLNIHENIIDSAINDSRSDPFYVEELALRVSSQEPEKAFETASYITASLIRAVFDNQAIPDRLEDEYRNACTQHSKKLKAGIFGGAILFLMGVFIGSFELILFGPISAFVITKMDSGYYRIEKKWKWFNIKE